MLTPERWNHEIPELSWLIRLVELASSGFDSEKNGGWRVIEEVSWHVFSLNGCTHACDCTHEHTYTHDCMPYAQTHEREKK